MIFLKKCLKKIRSSFFSRTFLKKFDVNFSNSVLLHGGGWKKLEKEKVSRKKLNYLIIYIATLNPGNTIFQIKLIVVSIIFYNVIYMLLFKFYKLNLKSKK